VFGRTSPYDFTSTFVCSTPPRSITDLPQTYTFSPIRVSDCCSLRSVRATLKGPVARKHFQAMSIARWGEGCRCRYVVKDTTSPAQHDGEDDAGDTNGDGACSVNSKGTGDEGGKSSDSNGNSGSSEDADWLAFYLRRVRHRAVRSSPLDLLQVTSPTRQASSARPSDLVQTMCCFIMCSSYVLNEATLCRAD